MLKKMFALGSVTALVGLVATIAAAGCSSTVTSTETPEGGSSTEAGDAKKTPIPDDSSTDDASGPPEEGTVGKTCAANTDCNVAGSKNDNQCSKGSFGSGKDDLFGTPVCVQGMCTQGAGGMVADLQCDDGAGLCLPTTSGGKSGICFPYCEYTSTTGAKCQGGNKCAAAYIGSGTMGAGVIGYCFAACQADADCKGTTGQKCQVETGACRDAANIVTFAKLPGAACDGAATTQECLCSTVGGTGANAAKGICSRQCLTGAAGDAVCNTAVAGWKCTAKLPTVDSMMKPLFTAQPPDVIGRCALPCTDDTTCATLNATGTPVKCKPFADGKYCQAADM